MPFEDHFRLSIQLIQIRYYCYSLLIGLPLMEEKNKVKVAFGDVNDKNINMLRKVNFETFPVKYIAIEYTALSRFCFYNDIIIGAYTVRIEDYKGQKHAYILTFGVLEPYRRYRIGYQMMENLEKEVKEKTDAEAIYLHMHVINEVGKKFYERCGFSVEERLDNYYTDLEEPHCYILRKQIRGQKPENDGQTLQKKTE